MTPIWLVRLYDFLAWLNPALGLIAGVLAMMIIAAAVEHLPAQASRPAAQATQPVQRPAPAACPQAALPPEWRDLLSYD